MKMDIDVLVIITIYLTLMVIPLLYNHRVVATKTTNRGKLKDKNGTGRQSHLNNSYSRNVIVLLGNLSEDDLEKVIEFLKNTDSP